jgi:ABC-2 type transport system permease protein
MVSGTPLVLNFFRGWLSSEAVDGLASLSVLTHFEALSKGLIAVKDLVFFTVMILYFLAMTVFAIEAKKAD